MPNTDYPADATKCPECHGEATIRSTPCPSCFGTGRARACKRSTCPPQACMAGPNERKAAIDRAPVATHPSPAEMAREAYPHTPEDYSDEHRKAHAFALGVAVERERIGDVLRAMLAAGDATPQRIAALAAELSK